MWWKRYEPILESKARPAFEVLLETLAKELVEATETFPPREDDVEWTDARMAEKYRGRLADLPKVDVRMCQLLCEVLRLDLTHETDAIDHLFRNEKHRVACPSEDHVDALHLLWRGTLEHLYARKEELLSELPPEMSLKTKHLVQIVDHFEERYCKKMLSIV